MSTNEAHYQIDRSRGMIWVLRLEGHLHMQTSEFIQRLWQDSAFQNDTFNQCLVIIVDLDAVSLSSKGLGLLTALRTRLQEISPDGTVALVFSADAKAAHVVYTTRMESIFPCFETVAEAVAHFSTDGGGHAA